MSLQRKDSGERHHRIGIVTMNIKFPHGFPEAWKEHPEAFQQLLIEEHGKRGWITPDGRWLEGASRARIKEIGEEVEDLRKPKEVREDE